MFSWKSGYEEIYFANNNKIHACYCSITRASTNIFLIQFETS